jgi:hypothetical protein
MCKLLITMGIGLFLCGCSQNEPNPSTKNLNTVQHRRVITIKGYSECKLLATGYLLCPKVRD